MFCNNCGKEIKGSAKFCPFCGASFVAPPRQEEVPPANVQPVLPQQEDAAATDAQTAPVQKRPRKKSKVKIVLLVIVLVLALTAAAGSVIFFTSPARQLSQSLSEGDYNSAMATYLSSVSDSSIQKWLANQLLSDAVTDIVEDYGNETVSYDEALTYLETVSQMTALDVAEDAIMQLESLQTIYASKQAYDLAESYYEAGDYEAAMDAYQEVDESDTERYEDAQSKIASATENYRAQIIEKVGSPSTTEEYETAISLLNSALAVLPDDEELTELLETCETELVEAIKSTALSEATDAIAAGEYEEAFDLLEAALKYAPEDSDLQALVSSAQSQYEEYIASQVTDLVTADDYDGALELIQQALKVLPSSTALKELQTTTSNQKPVKLSELKISDSTRYSLVENLEVNTDVVGNIYDPGNLFIISTSYWSGDGYADYYLNGGYTRLKGTVAVSDDSDSDECTLTIYGDGENILYTKTFTRTTAPDTIDIDLSGVEWFEIRLSGKTDMDILVSNFILYKD